MDQSDSLNRSDTGLPKAVNMRPKVEKLRVRSDFLRVASGYRWRAPGLLVQGRPRKRADRDPVVRIGFTCSRKLGNAVVRNRARRRMRHAANLVVPGYGRPGWDYVMIGLRDRTANRQFDRLVDDLRTAIQRINRLHPG